MKSYFKTKHEKDSARITGLIAVILILLIFIVGPKYMDPPLEYGVAVNFGTTDFGSGNVQPKKPIRQAPKEIVTPPKKVEETKPTPSKPQETKAENVITEDNAESIAIKKQKEEALKKAKEEAKEEAKAKAEAERIEREEKAEAERLEKERQVKEAKRNSVNDLIGGIKNSSGTDSGSEGNDNKAGDKGQLNGDPYAPAVYSGTPGSGGGGTGYGLRGRGTPNNKQFKPECNEEGRVVVEIQVNRQGRVVNAVPGKRGTTGVSCLFDAAKRTAMSYNWPANSKAPEKQVGFVVINFSVTQ